MSLWGGSLRGSRPCLRRRLIRREEPVARSAGTGAPATGTRIRRIRTRDSAATDGARFQSGCPAWDEGTVASDFQVVVASKWRLVGHDGHSLRVTMLCSGRRLCLMTKSLTSPSHEGVNVVPAVVIRIVPLGLLAHLGLDFVLLLLVRHVDLAPAVAVKEHLVVALPEVVGCDAHA